MLCTPALLYKQLVRAKEAERKWQVINNAYYYNFPTFFYFIIYFDAAD